ncbi:Phosphoenolpyruvate-protein phosphotransferase [Neochlamydia sp. AcF65]|uniref:phosphoenolpyruvate--protein phosphotransferase n=1 Tax=Neochlamydia sp. AcF65 TaxID=2795735 RepID=UPI001BCA3596|nr:phosphoenolpyruvate--protein phosphotransferase [Neochlamydia sp. AcF65]MBS4167238.1 Phosphoenolpyruvate-protein phosphotransferase [Neochlamydia sp. AcF65]
MPHSNLEEIRLTGNVISSGIAIGKPFFLKTLQKSFPDENIPAYKVEAETERFQAAVQSVISDLQAIKNQLELDGMEEGAAILEAQLQLLSDPLLITEVSKQIHSKRKIPEYILHQLIQEYQKKFDTLEDMFFRERFKDVQDISRRIMAYLHQETKSAFDELLPDSILFVKDLSPAETAEASQKCVRAIVSERGSATAHAAILARAKEIPYMTNIAFDEVSDCSDYLVIVDGRNGELIFNPSSETLAQYERLSEELNARRLRLRQTDSHDIETYDGYKMRLLANIETSSEVKKIHEYGGEGVGLYRSENILVGRERLPTEDEQFEIYRQLVENMQGLPITIRTFDVGRDKAGIEASPGQTGNAFLGFRAVGSLEREKDIFMTQLRAILRASAFGEVNILFPMVSSLPELIEAKRMTQEAARQVKVNSLVNLGCMIEVPSAAIISDLLARESDFLSIGTNDLIQYTLAVDRCDNTMSHLYQPMHPCVLRLIRHVVIEANRHNVPVSICGEMAANPKYIPLLMGLGIQELSVAARYIPLIKQAIRCSSIISCCKLAEKALSLASTSEIQALLDETFYAHFARASLEELM